MADYNPGTDPQSSNSLIRAYLASKGLQANGENVRRALEANYANRGTIPGLVNSLPSTEAEDQAAMAAARHGIGGNSRGAGIPTPPNPAGTSGLPLAQQDTSAAPGSASDGSGDGEGFPWLAAAAGGAGAAMAPLLSRLAGGRSSQTRVPATATEPGMDLGDIRLSLNRPELAGPVDVGGAQVNLGRQAQPRLLPNAAQPSLGAGIVNGEPLSIGAPAPQLPAPAPQLAAPQTVDGRPVANPNEPIPLSRPGAPDVIELPKNRVRVQAGSGPVPAEPQITDTVPAIDTPSTARVRKPRASRARVRVP
jgi:hypothetical protein